MFIGPSTLLAKVQVANPCPCAYLYINHFRLFGAMPKIVVIPIAFMPGLSVDADQSLRYSRRRLNQGVSDRPCQLPSSVSMP